MRRTAALLALTSSALSTLGALAALVVLGPRASDLPGRPLSPGGWTGWIAGQRPDETIAAVAGLAAYAVVAWLSVGLLAAAAGRLPGAMGRRAQRVAEALTPVALRRLTAAAMGAALGLGGAAPAQADTDPAGLDWPAATATATPATAAAPRAARASAVPPVPTGPTPRADRQPATEVTVRPGDCLWTIAAQHLPGAPTAAQIADSWPRWYEANRDVIGPEPDLVLPGQRLTPPG